MNAAFHFVPALPSARARVFAGRDLAGAGGAADRGVALFDQRMARQRVQGHIGLDIRLAPRSERIELQPPFRVSVVDLEARQARARGGLEALAPANRGIEAAKRARQRLHLSDLAAPVRVPRPAQAVLVLLGDKVHIRLDDQEVRQPQMRDQLIAVGQRFEEMLVRFQKDHRHRLVHRCQQMQQHRTFRAEAGDHGNFAEQPVAQHAAQHFGRVGAAEEVVQPDRVTVLADTAIRGHDLDEAKALEAKKRAEEAMHNRGTEFDLALAQSEFAMAAAQLAAIARFRRKK